MATIQEFLSILHTIDTAQLTAILALVSLVLVLLIYLASRRRNDDANIAEPALPKNHPRHHHPEPAPTRANPQPRVNEPAVQTEIKTAPPPIADKTPPAIETRTAPSAPQPASAHAPHIPEDSVLRRHYLANLEAEKWARTTPYPTDAVLRRHYDALHNPSVTPAPAPSATTSPPSAATQAPETKTPPAPTAKASIIELALNKESPIQSVFPKSQPVAPCRMPQDSVLKRHFISQLQADIEAGFSPKPSDSVLLRHYESQVASALESRLAE